MRHKGKGAPWRIADEWIEVAESDLGYAKAGFRETRFYPQVCVQCQQAAEKIVRINDQKEKI